MKEKEEIIENNGEEIALESESNDIKIAEGVVASIAGVAVTEVSGVFGMSGGFVGGISEAFTGKKNITKGIKVELQGSEAKIDVHIIVEFGARIPDVAYEIQKRVKKAVEDMTGLKVSGVGVHVQDVKMQGQEEKDKDEVIVLEEDTKSKAKSKK